MEVYNLWNHVKIFLLIFQCNWIFLIARKHYDMEVVESEIQRNYIIWITCRKVRKNFVCASCKDLFLDRNQILKDFC
jgi:hypothetical protein